jgi:hypothetical protein
MGGYHLFYAVYQSGLKREMKTYLAAHTDAKLGSVFSFAHEKKQLQDKAFEWEETDEEFTYQHALYDVIAIRYTADSVYIHALCDDKENQLEQQLAAVRAAGGVQHKTLHSSKAFPVFIAPEKITLNTLVLTPSLFHSIAVATFPESESQNLTPPPRLC